MFRLRALTLPGVALALTASCSPPTTAPGSPAPGSPAPGPTRAQPASEQAAVALGVTIVASDERGAPRLVRAVVPRPGGAGMTPEEAARDHLAALTPLWMHHQRASELATSGVQQLRNGASVVRLQQQVDHVDIHQGELRVMVHPDGSLAAVSGTMRPSSGRARFQSTASAALDRALDALYGTTRARPAIVEGTEQAGYRGLTVASTPEFQVQSARAKRELLPQGDQLLPIWTVEVFSEKAGRFGTQDSAARRYLIADADGRVVRDINLTANDAFVYRAFADTTGNRTPFDGALKSYNPHPTGMPDGSVPDFDVYNLVVMEAFNGPHDPWLGTMATTTSGNNVEAFADIAPPRGFNDGDIRPEVRGGRTLNYRYDFTADPLATPTQSKAAAVNVFFVTNWLHDWYYDSGFTEATGNAQVDNLGRGGVAGDPLIAHAQSDALGGSRDNANMSVPEDGLSPVMNMFLWSGKVVASLTTPTATPAAGRFLPGPSSFDLTGTVVLAEDTAGGTHTACGPIAPTASGQIVLFEFDASCLPSAALDNVKAAGAVGAILMIAIPGAPAQTIPGSPTANLPALNIDNEDGLALEAQLPATVTLHLEAATLEHDGDFDNAIISHEWGHYLHHRLASCEQTSQCAAMSEGWGDFNALQMMLRETDNRDGTFATGLYALTAGGLAQAGFTDPGYFGIRRFPYSTDRTKNALSFRHIADDQALPSGPPINPGPAANPNSEVHNAGEVWAAMMWEAYNVLIDDHSFAEAHRRMADYVVAGLMLTPPEATYTEARDAILTAAGALDTDDMLLMAAAFAGRGAGTCAASPARASLDFTGVVESGTIAARLETSGISVTDDGVSCDHDGYLDPGESGTLRITIANSGVIAAEDVVVTATTTTPGVTLGKPISLGNVAPLTHIDLEIPVKLSTTAPTNTSLDIAIRVDGDAGCNTSTLVASLHQPMGVDEAAGVATTDTVETKLVAWTATGDSAGEVWSRAEDAGGNHVLFGIDPPFISDTQLVSPVLQASTTAPLVVTVHHAYDFDAFAPDFFFDGGVVEVSNDSGATWRDVTAVGVDPGYPAVITPDTGDPLAGRSAFSGTSAMFPARAPLVLDFGTQFAGQAVQIRFRMGSDICCNFTGWEIDDIAVTGITNTPFPGFIAQPTTCLAHAAASDTAGDTGGVIAVRRAPRNSLDGVPGAAEQP